MKNQTLRERVGPLRATITILIPLLAGACLSLDGQRSAERIGERRLAASRHATETTESPNPERAPRIDGTVDLPRALALALRNNTSLRTVLAQREVAEGRITASLSGALPTLRATAGIAQLDESPAPDDNRQAVSLRATQPLYRAGSVSAAIDAARMFAAQTEAVIREAVQDTLHGTALAYHRVVLEHQLLQVAEAAVRSAEAQLSDVRTQRSQGTASDYDVLRAEVEVAHLRANLIKQRNAGQSAMATLLQRIGLSQESRLELTDTLRFDAETHDLAEASSAALANRPDLHQAEAAVAMQREAVRIARADFYPALDLFAESTYSNPDPHEAASSEWGDAWSAGATLSYDLFDGLQRRGKLAEEQARLRQLEMALLEAEERAHVEVVTALLQLRNADELVASQAQNLGRAKEALRLAEIRFREGQSTQVEILDARSAVTLAQGLHYESIFAHLASRLEIRRATGAIGPRPGQFFNPDAYTLDPAQIPGAR